MSPFESLSGFFFNYNSLFYWRNIIEISFFAMLFYYAAVWLKRDKQKNLLPAFYGYCALTFATHYMGLTAVSSALFLFAPVTAMIFILIHQELLQKNVVALKNITPAKRIHIDWLETLIRASLQAINEGKSITCVIEQQNTLHDFLTTPLLFHATFKQGLFDILLKSPSFDQKQMIWINTQGELVGINATWNKTIGPEHVDQQAHNLPKWKQQAIFFTTKTDSIVLHISPTSRTFDVVMNGMVVDRMHATKTLELLKKYVMTKKPTSQWEGMNYESSTQKRSSKQRTT